MRWMGQHGVPEDDMGIVYTEGWGEEREDVRRSGMERYGWGGTGEAYMVECRWMWVCVWSTWFE